MLLHSYIFGQTQNILNIYSSHFRSNSFKKNVMFTDYIVPKFSQVTKVFGLLYLVMFTGLIRSSFLGHLNNPQIYWLPFRLCLNAYANSV